MSEASSGIGQDSKKEEKEERDVLGELKPEASSGAYLSSCFLCVRILCV